MFADIEADIYLMVDGDDTYDATFAPALINKLLSGPYDSVNASRKHVSDKAYRHGHQLGNKLLTSLVATAFGRKTQDMLSGYKALSKRFVKSFLVFSSGFEIETELLVHALEMNAPLAEVETPYYERPEGSTSKLSTYKDVFNILKMIGFLIKNERPLAFFSSVSALLVFVACVLFYPIFITYIETGLVPRLPTAILSFGIMATSILLFIPDLILDGIVRARKETKMLRYLSIPATASKK